VIFFGPTFFGTTTGLIESRNKPGGKGRGRKETAQTRNCGSGESSLSQRLNLKTSSQFKSIAREAIW
jgi:hypothetical protein